MNKQLLISFLCGLMVVAGTACKNENTPENKTVQKRHLTIKVQGDEGQSTKVSPRHIANASITDEGTTLIGSWTEGDPVSCCNLSVLSAMNSTIITGSMTATSTGRRSDLTGTVECMVGDELAIIYPVVDLSSSSYDMGDGIHGKFTISLAGQDGTLDRLASNYHYVYGRAHVVSAAESIAEATMDPMQSLLTVCKFSFEDKDNPGTALPINMLTISYGGDGDDKNTYPQSANVEVTSLTTNTQAQAVGVASSSVLTINAGGATEVYVALLPEIASRTYNFTVTNNNGTYTGTASAWLKKGEYVPATGLKLTEQP